MGLLCSPHFPYWIQVNGQSHKYGHVRTCEHLYKAFINTWRKLLFLTWSLVPWLLLGRKRLPIWKHSELLIPVLLRLLNVSNMLGGRKRNAIYFIWENGDNVVWLRLAFDQKGTLWHLLHVDSGGLSFRGAFIERTMAETKFWNCETSRCNACLGSRS